MQYWWVNQNKTWQYEISGGYLWSPKCNRNGAYNQFYTNMQLVEEGDMVFSFFSQHIQAVGRVIARAIPQERPAEFGQIGEVWTKKGWYVTLKFEKISIPFRPKDIITELRPFLPVKYSPLTKEGNGLQGVYLAEISDAMAQILMKYTR